MDTPEGVNHAIGYFFLLPAKGKGSIETRLSVSGSVGQSVRPFRGRIGGLKFSKLSLSIGNTRCFV